jgi:hypothetical protein
MEEQNEPIIDALEEAPPIEDFKTKIEEIYNDLPQSIKLEYQTRLKKHDIENDFETEASYKILEKLNNAYERKRERSRKNSQIKRDTMKALATKLNIETRSRGRPKKNTTSLPEPTDPPPPLQKEPPSELPEPEPEPEPFEMDEDDNDDINELLKDVKIEPKKEGLPPLPPPSPLIRHSLSSLFS